MHLGGPKTGTSAIQRSLMNSTEKLQNLDISYNGFSELNSKETTTGNGFEIVKNLRQRAFKHLESDIERLFKGRNAAILSNEDLVYVTTGAWMEFTFICKRIEIRPYFILFVRDVYDYLVSSYGEKIKHGYNKTFENAVVSGDLYYTHGTCLEELAPAIDHEVLKVIKYDGIKGEGLLNAFESALDIPLGTLKNREEIVNRSLTAVEAAVVKRLSENMSPTVPINATSMMTLSLSRYLMSNTGIGHREDFQLTSDVLALLNSRYQTTLSWMNKNFFQNREAVVIRRSDMYPQYESSSDHDQLTAYQRAFDWAVSRLQDSYLDEMKRRDALRLDIALELARKSIHPENELPKDFNPFTYLMLNPDLIDAMADPCIHYVEFGKEEGRIYTV